jgi:hypothetical protein
MAKHNLYKQAPVYAPNAIPSPAGWRDPRTNELLVAIKLNMSDFDDVVVVVEETVVEQAEATPEAVEHTEEVTEAAVEQTEEVVTEPEVAQEVVAEQTEEVVETESTEPAKQSKAKNSKK